MTFDRSARQARTALGARRVLLLAAACSTVFSALAGAPSQVPAAKPAPALNAPPATSSPPAAPAAPAPSAQFAKVGDTVITHQEFDSAFAQAARAKFYHGKPPEGAIAVLQREVGQSMVDEILLAREAKRRKVQPDSEAVKKTLDGYEKQYAKSEQWKANRARLLPGLKAKLEADSQREQLNKQVKNVGKPTPRQLEQYWETHKEKFTSPEQVHVGMILLKVDPSSPQTKWDGAREEGAAIVKRLKGGADFKELAKLHSGDASAAKGGDMGYVHRGMLPEPAQLAVDKLKPGEITDAVVLLEGVSVLRLEARTPPKLNPLDAVRERTADLWARDKGEEVWTALLVKLRRETPVKLDDSRFLPLIPATATSGGNAAPR